MLITSYAQPPDATVSPPSKCSPDADLHTVHAVQPGCCRLLCAAMARKDDEKAELRRLRLFFDPMPSGARCAMSLAAISPAAARRYFSHYQYADLDYNPPFQLICRHFFETPAYISRHV